MWYKKMIDKKKMDEIIAGNAFASYLGMELVEWGLDMPEEGSAWSVII